MNDVTGVMKGNIEKVLDRGEKLEDLEERTDELTVAYFLLTFSCCRLSLLLHTFVYDEVIHTKEM